MRRLLLSGALAALLCAQPAAASQVVFSASTNQPAAGNVGTFFCTTATGDCVEPYLVVLSIPLTLQAGDVITVTSSCTRSVRADASQNYAGFAGDAFAASQLVISTDNPFVQEGTTWPNLNLNWSDAVKINGGFQEDIYPAQVYGWNVPGHPYQTAINNAVYTATAPDAGQRWLDLVMWNSSNDAVQSQWPYLLIESASGECQMDVKQERP